MFEPLEPRLLVSADPTLTGAILVDPVVTLDTREYQKPSGADFYKWIQEKEFKML